MKLKIRDKLLNESGISLIEVIASVVILTIVILGVFGMFIQSAKTTKHSEEIVDATYIAQTEMERLYSLSRTYNSSIIKNYYTQEEIGQDYQFKKTEPATNFFITLRVTDIGNNLTRIVIRVYEKEGDLQPKAQMQNTIEWRS